MHEEKILRNDNHANMYKFSSWEKCPICGPLKEDFSYHKTTVDHKFNFALYEWNEYKKALVKNRHGVEVQITVNKHLPKILNIKKIDRKGQLIVTTLEKNFITIKDGIEFDIIIENKRHDDSIILLKANILHILKSFSLEDPKKIVSNDQHAELLPGAQYPMKVRFKTYGVGKFQMAVGFLFKDKKTEFEFTIARELVINLITNIDDEITYEKIKSPYTGLVWTEDVVIKSAVNHEPDTRYSVPKEIKKILSYGLKKKNFTGEELQKFEYISNIVNKGCVDVSYQEYYHYLLWMDELGAEIKLEKYNLEKIPFKFNKKFIEVEVPGLAEKRPSVIKGDEVRIKIHGSSVGYCGVVERVLENTIWISKIQNEFLNKLQSDPSILVDINFSISRLSYVRMHQAIDYCGADIKEIFFPSKPIYNYQERNIEIFYNSYIKENVEQKKAVSNIVYRSSGCSPFIVFGPPGTGKTITICEAVVQIAMRNPYAKILICAPANAACDMLTGKLIEYFDNQRLIRIHSENVDWSTVPEKIRKYSNRDGNAIKRYSGSDLSKFQIVVSTLILIGRYTKDFKRSHVFIDEAAQAVEPEVAIAIGGILEERGQVVLAGDHKQLGPVINSRAAEEKGLGTSLLKRLIHNHPQYEPIKENTNYIVKLKLNYRSHPQIIHLPNDLFYKGELVPVSGTALNDPINKIILPVDTRVNIKPAAIEFYATSGKEEKDGSSPSYFNQHEVIVVAKYIELLLKHPLKVLPEEIGIITPYQRQVFKIKGMLAKKNIEGVEVGTVEIFQGREKRIIIISTVRGTPNLLLEDSKYNLGFVSNEPRFNVAVTRAISKLIIVGNPFVLCYGLKTWKPLMSFCRNLGSFRGCTYVERNSDTKHAILEKLRCIKIKDDQYNYKS